MDYRHPTEYKMEHLITKKFTDQELQEKSIQYAKNLLIKERTDEFNELFGKAVYSDDDNVVRVLLKSEYLTEYILKDLFYYACEVEKVKVLEVFLKCTNLGPNTPSASGVPVFLHYINCGKMNTTKLFIKHGADINIADSIGTTALHHAAAHYDTEMVKYLLEKGANKKARNYKGQTPLDYCKELLQYRCGEKPSRKKLNELYNLLGGSYKNLGVFL